MAVLATLAACLGRLLAVIGEVAGIVLGTLMGASGVASARGLLTVIREVARIAVAVTGHNLVPFG